MEENYYNPYVLDILEKSITSFKKIDEIFVFLPKDINRHIYSFITPICDECESCCNICRINCYYVYDCNRGKVCCITELNLLSKKFDNKKIYSSDDLDIKENNELDEL